MEHIDGLRALNDADRWIERVIAQRDHLPEMQELSTLESHLRELVVALQSAQQVAEPVRQSYLGARESAAKLTARALELEAALSSSTGSARDLGALQHELEQVRQRVDAAEDEELNALVKLEPLDEAITQVKAQAQPGVVRRGELQRAIAQLRATLDEEIAALRESRRQLADALEPSWRQRYESALSRAGISGAAHVDAGRCDGCRIALSPLDVDRFRHLEPGVVMNCPECGRLLLA